MFCVTKVMDTGPFKIAKLSEGLVLPKTVEVRPFMWKAAGLVIMGFAAFQVAGLSFWTGLACVLGWNSFKLLSSWSPLPGESLATWITLSASARANSVIVDGERVRVYIGTAPVGRLAAGKIEVRPSCTDVTAGTVDDLWGPADTPSPPWRPGSHQAPSNPSPFAPVPRPAPGTEPAQSSY